MARQEVRKTWGVGRPIFDWVCGVFRSVAPGGVLVFKTERHEIPVSRVLSLTDERPLFGNKCGSCQISLIVFMKEVEA